MDSTYFWRSFKKHKSNVKYPELDSIESNFSKRIRSFFIFTNYFWTDVFLITDSDDLFGFGHNSGGRLGFGHSKPVKEPEIITELCGKAVTDIKCGNGFSVALSKFGQIYTFGRFKRTGTKDNYYKPILLSVNKQIIVAIDCTLYSAFVLTETGQLYWFGYFHNNYSSVFTPTRVAFPITTNIRAFSCGNGKDHILALTDEGKVFSWGNNCCGQLGLGHKDHTDCPQIIEFKESIKQVSCGYSHSLVLTNDGKVYSFGRNTWGQLGIGNKVSKDRPQLVKTGQKEICCYKEISMSLDVNNRLFIWINIKNGLVSPVLSELKSFQEVVNTYAKHRSTLKQIELIKTIKVNSNIPELLPNKLEDKQTESGNNLIKTMTKAFNNPENSDLIFRFKFSENEFKYIYCHKWFIKETSEYMKSMIENVMKTNKITGQTSTTPSAPTELTLHCRKCFKNRTIKIQINEYSYKPYYLYLKSLYTDFIESEIMEELLEVLSITDRYRDSDKKTKCVERIKLLTKFENVCSVYSSSIKYSSGGLREYAFRLMSENMSELISTTDYKKTNPIYIKEFFTEYQIMLTKCAPK